ncbi:CLUMA_CG009585, isoform A [Clunio marinus]|uniref:CLUMA_CG009585, isoform A n=1 Tax=Clunio marinus TaxID=568069 RepID=A0A1J1I9A9_9DIPT|nr:CLUMA_CG009585, isoform A [Clunio marinus]
MLKLCLTVILLGCVTQINCENLPVFIWGQKTPSFLPTLSHLNGDEFMTLVKSQTDKETLTVVFVENSLSVEDLSQCKLKTETCFQNLRKIQQKTYLTAVDDPIRALESSFGKQSQKTLSLSNDGDLSEKLETSGNEKILFIYLDDAENNEDFAKHDELMNNLYNLIISKRENVIAIYTARHPSFSYSTPLIRKARDTAETSATLLKPAAKQLEQAQHVISTNPHFLIAMSEITVGTTPVDPTLLVLTQNATAELMEVSLVYDTHNFGMSIKLSGGTWYVSQFTYNGNRFHESYPVTASSSRSFGCIELPMSDFNTIITFHNIQMQPLFNPVGDEKIEHFADRANECIGFFSPAIWGALFVVIIFVFILSMGITMMMDIRTMDRFDDPKGKTITINSQE